MNKSAMYRQYQPICGNNFIFFNANFSFFISCDKEDYDIMANKRIKRLEFHVDQNDYFGTLATGLSLLLERRTKKQKEFLKKYADDLVYLQKLYKIIKK
jgi:hypothetical protein